MLTAASGLCTKYLGFAAQSAMCVAVIGRLRTKLFHPVRQWLRVVAPGTLNFQTALEKRWLKTVHD
jgi:hypothetical protein